MILNNYSNNDLLSNCTRLVMATHIALAYPVIFYPAQIGVVTFIKYTIKYCYSHRYTAYLCHAKLHYKGGGRGGDGDVISEKVDLLLDPDEGGGDGDNDKDIADGDSDEEEQGAACGLTRNQVIGQVIGAREDKNNTVESSLLSRVTAALVVASVTSFFAILIPQVEVVFG